MSRAWAAVATVLLAALPLGLTTAGASTLPVHGGVAEQIVVELDPTPVTHVRSVTAPDRHSGPAPAPEHPAPTPTGVADGPPVELTVDEPVERTVDVPSAAPTEPPVEDIPAEDPAEGPAEDPGATPSHGVTAAPSTGP